MKDPNKKEEDIVKQRLTISFDMSPETKRYHKLMRKIAGRNSASYNVGGKAEISFEFSSKNQANLAYSRIIRKFNKIPGFKAEIV